MDIKKIAYRKYIFDWMLTQGINEKDLDRAVFDYLLDNRETDSPESFSNFLFEHGFGHGSIWVCFDEFLGAEYLDKDYMRSLLTPEEFAEYAKDNGLQGTETLVGKVEKLTSAITSVPPLGCIQDADTLLADYANKADLDITGLSKEIFGIWKKSTDRKAVEDMFFEFTDIKFGDFLEEAASLMEKEIEEVVA